MWRKVGQGLFSDMVSLAEALHYLFANRTYLVVVLSPYGSGCIVVVWYPQTKGYVYPVFTHFDSCLL